MNVSFTGNGFVFFCWQCFSIITIKPFVVDGDVTLSCLCMHQKILQFNSRTDSVPLGRAGLGVGTLCTDTPEDCTFIFVDEDDEEDEEEPRVLEESPSDVTRVNVSPRPQFVSSCRPPAP